MNFMNWWWTYSIIKAAKQDITRALYFSAFRGYFTVTFKRPCYTLHVRISVFFFLYSFFNPYVSARLTRTTKASTNEVTGSLVNTNCDLEPAQADDASTRYRRTAKLGYDHRCWDFTAESGDTACDSHNRLKLKVCPVDRHANLQQRPRF